MEKKFEELSITITIKIGIAPKYLSNDVAMLDLLTGLGDINNSKYTKNSFIDEINKGNVIVALLKDDPIAYAIVNSEKSIDEMYIAYSFRHERLKSYIKDYVQRKI